MSNFFVLINREERLGNKTMLLHKRQLNLTKNLVMRGGRIVVVDGLSSSPSINFESYAETGIYLVSAP